jgi:transcriptional regulator with XRE-family HTH domain
MLAQLRKEAGLSQYELARLVGVPQSNIAYWELSDKPPRSEIIPRLAKLLGVSAESLLNGREVKRKRNGPVGKTKKAFEEVSKLPRRQQDKIVEFVSALVSQYQQSKN